VNLETGNVLNSPAAPQCIETFRTRVEDGVVLLELPIQSAANREMPGVCIEEGGETHGLDQINLRMDGFDYLNDWGIASACARTARRDVEMDYVNPKELMQEVVAVAKRKSELGIGTC